MSDMPTSGAGAAPAADKASISQEQRLIAAILVAMAILGALASVPLWTGHVSVYGDLGAFFLPLRTFYARCLAEGDSFDWMPRMFGGFYASGEGQHGPYHPLHWLLYRFAPVDVATGIELMLPYLLLPLGLFLFLRRYVDRVAAWMGALLFTYSEQFTHTLGNPQTACIIAHTPWILIAMRAQIERQAISTRILACVAIALMTASQFLIGYPQSAWFSIFIEVFYAVFLLLNHWPSWSGWVMLAGAKLLGVCLAAVQILPSQAALVGSTRAYPTLEFKLTYSLPPKALLGTLAPYLDFGQLTGRHGTYFGAVAIVLALWWISGRRLAAASGLLQSRGKRVTDHDTTSPHSAVFRLSFIAALIFVAATWLALGRYGGLYYVQTLLPVIGSFRAPGRYTLAAEFGLAIVAAIAFARLRCVVSGGEKVPWKHLAGPWLAAVVSLIVAAWSAVRANGLGAHNLQMEFYTGPLMVGGAVIALTLAARGRQLGFYALIVVAAVDLGFYGLGACKNYWWQAPTYQQYIASRDGPPDPCPGRIYDNLWGMNVFAVQDRRLITGYAGLEPAQRLDYQHVNSLRVAEVCWYRDLDFGRPPRSIPGVAAPIDGGWCKVPDPLPRARLLDRAVVSNDPREDIKRIDVDTTALLDHPVELRRSTPGAAKILSDRPGRIILETAAPERQLLVISESYHAGWRAYLDDRPIEVEAVNGDFIGCLVPAGDHRVRLEFAPGCLAAGKAISLGSVVLTTLLAAFAIYRRRIESRASLEQLRILAAFRDEASHFISVPLNTAARKIIFCVPVLDDWDCAAMLIERIDRVLEQRQHLTASVLLVDDGSINTGPAELFFRLQAINRVEILRLRRNMGHQRAIAVGLKYIHARRQCDAVVVMDADGEDSPEDVPGLLEKFECHRGERVIFAQRGRRSEGVVFRFFYQCYKLVHRLLTGRTIDVGNFSVLPADQLDRLVGVSEQWNHYAASVFKAQLPADKVPIDRGERFRGRSKMRFSSLVRHGLNAMAVFREQVARRLLVFSSVVGALTLLGVVAVVAASLGFGATVVTWVVYALALSAVMSLGAMAIWLTIRVSIVTTHGNLPSRTPHSYEQFASGVRVVRTRLTALPGRCGRRAA